MDTRQCPATRALLLNARCTRRLAEHSALSNKDDVAVGEFLLELSGEPGLDAQSV